MICDMASGKQYFKNTDSIGPGELEAFRKYAGYEKWMIKKGLMYKPVLEIIQAIIWSKLSLRDWQACVGDVSTDLLLDFGFWLFIRSLRTKGQVDAFAKIVRNEFHENFGHYDTDILKNLKNNEDRLALCPGYSMENKRKVLKAAYAYLKEILDKEKENEPTE